MGAVLMRERLYTVDEVTQILRLGRQTIIKRIQNGEIVASKIGREYRIRESDLEEYLRRTRNVQPSDSDEDE